MDSRTPYVITASLDMTLLAYLGYLYHANSVTLYSYTQIYGPLSLSPAIGPLTALVSASSAVATLLASRDKRLGDRCFAALLVTFTSLVVAAQLLLPDLVSRYYLANWVSDSYEHLWGEGMYLAMYGHVTPYPTFMWFNRAFWFTFAESVLALWGHPGYYMAAPALFTPKWFPLIMSIAVAPPVYLLARSLGLGRRASAAAVTMTEALWPIIPYAASESWATVTFTAALAFFIVAATSSERRGLVPLVLASLAFVYTHEYPAAVGTVALLGAGVMLLTRRGLRSSTLTALAAVASAWLIMGIYDSHGFVQGGIHYYWDVVTSTLRSLFVKAPQVIAQSTAKAYVPYERAVRIEAYTFILDLAVPFFLALAMIRDKRGKALFGAVGGGGLIGAGLSIPTTIGLGWSYRVPLLLVGLLSVTLVLFAEARRHRRAALAAVVLAVSLLVPLTIYTEYTGYSQLAVPERGGGLTLLNVVTESGGYQPGIVGELAPGTAVQGDIPWYGSWCSNETPSFPSGVYLEYYYREFVYYVYVVCPNYVLLSSRINSFASNNSVVVDTNIGFLSLTR
mgnify:CR=1 FL=1